MSGLDTDALAQAFADHERQEHGVPYPDDVPADCLADVKVRYDAIVEPGVQPVDDRRLS